MRRATTGSGVFSRGMLRPIARQGRAYFVWSMATREKKEKRKSEPLSPESDYQASERILQAARLRKDEWVLWELGPWPDAFPAVLLNLCTIFHACTPCLARWTKLKKRASHVHSSKETVHTNEQLLIMMWRQVLTVRRLSMLQVSLRKTSRMCRKRCVVYQ